MQNNASFLAMPEHPCMITRLIDEMREASREFRESFRPAMKNGQPVSYWLSSVEVEFNLR